MRKWELIKNSKQLKIKIEILLNFFNEKYKLNLVEFHNATGTERVKFKNVRIFPLVLNVYQSC